MMNYFALIVDGIVQEVITVSSDNCAGLSYPESEPVGQAFIESLGIDGVWIQTSVDGQYRKHFAGYGMVYNAQSDVFISTKPFASWSLDENYDWQAPIDYPADGKLYSWDEANQVWVEVPAI